MKQVRLSMLSVVLRVATIVTAAVFMVPVLLTILKSFDQNGILTLEGYRQLLFNCFPLYTFFWNSIIDTVLITAGTLLIAIPAAFAFKFAQFKGKKLLYITYIVIMMMPLQVTILPNYIGLRDMGILNSRMAVIVPMLFAPFGVVVIHQYMREIDCGVIEAARLETNSVIRILLHGILPQIRVCIAATALFVYAQTWNMVEQPLLYVDDDKLRTLSTFIAGADKYSPEVLLPASVLFMIPVFLCYLMFHEELKAGLKL